jgi:hypothetical protein
MRSYCGEGTCPSPGGRIEVLRLHMPQTWVSLENLRPTVSLGEASSKARADHLEVVRRRPPTTPT